MDARRAGALILVAGLVLVLVGGPAVTQKVPRATCLDCHEKEGMRYANLIVSPLLELQQNETYPVEVTITNPWRHEITDTAVTLALRTPDTLSFATRDPFNGTAEATLGSTPGTQAEVTLQVPVATGATGAVVRMVQDAGPQAADVDLTLSTTAAPDGRTVQPADGVQATPPTPPRRVESFAFDQEGVTAEGTGNWTATAALGQRQGLSGGFPTDVVLEAHVWYNATRSLTIRDLTTLAEGQSNTFTFDVVGDANGPAEIGVRTVVTAYYLHPAGIGAQDEGNETLTSQVTFEVGDETRLGEQVVVAETPINWNIIARTWAEATGWVGLFLVPVSLVLGGAFGRRNVLWMNKVARNGRTRVLWHNAVSFTLLAFTVVHIVLFIIEPVYEWSVGLVWGGIGTLALLGLAITGLLWRDIARKWGYHTWRTWHIAMAIIFVATTLVHVLAEGAHFDWARQAFGFA